jgi:NAD(P)-dependent dehydrogenase (short-subunit alcohol dehydrogenase family)
MDVEATALITGTSSGLGRQLARALGERGWTVLAHGRDSDRVAHLVDELGGAARPYIADLSSLAEVQQLAAQVTADVPRLDVLVNNAAVGFGPPGQSRQVSHDGHELRFAVNYLAPVLLTRSLLPLLTRSAPARIVNVGSLGQAPFDVDDIAFAEGYDGTTAYRRAKLALVAFTFDLAEQLRHSGVTVNCVHPAGFMDTAMVRESGIAPQSRVEDGVDATLRLIVDGSLERTTGQFFNGRTMTRAIPQAYDRDFQQRLGMITTQLLDGTSGAPF